MVIDPLWTIMQLHIVPEVITIDSLNVSDFQHLPWPPQSPDLTLIENVRDMGERDVRQNSPIRVFKFKNWKTELLTSLGNGTQGVPPYHIKMYLGLEEEMPGLRRSFLIGGLEGARGCGNGDSFEDIRCDGNFSDYQKRKGALGSLVVKVTDSWPACHEFDPSTAEDPPFRRAMHVNLTRAQTSFRWCGVVNRRVVPAQVSSSSLYHGSK
ncbi:hypothetical protein TNCV_4008351 [Trichonephila clavipes]|nr:hypothetical protein TNCV_4008351 [Trichonephila clavipes]